MLFLRNEFSKNFDDLFTMALNWMKKVHEINAQTKRDSRDLFDSVEVK